MTSALVAQRLRRFFEGRPTLVTGGASFIGSHLVELLVASGANVRVADDLSSGRLANLEAVRPAIEFLELDLRRPENARRAAEGASVVFHLAACHGGRGYIETHPVECSANMALDQTVFSEAVAAGARTLVFASSACVYPTNLQESADDRRLLVEGDAGFEEPGKAFADGEYGWAKLMGELQLRAFAKQYGVDAVACRIFTAYGERENESHAVIALIAKAAARLDPFPIWGDGTQTRNFTYVADTVTGLALAAASLTGFAVVNVGSSRHHTVLELLEEIFAAVGWRPSAILRELDRPVGVKSRAADNALSRARLGWEPEVSLEEGVARTARWYLSTTSPQRLARLEALLMERG